MTVFDWPTNLKPRQVGFNLRGMSVGGPLSLSGFSQAASANADYWIAMYDGQALIDPDKVNTFRALRSLLKGGSNQIRVPAFDDAQTPWVLDGNSKPIRPSALGTPFASGAYFANGVGFLADTIYAPVLNAAAIGATQLVLNAATIGTLVAGQLFSLVDRLYSISSIISISGANYTVSIEPPLRDAVVANQLTNFSSPVCRMRLMTDAEMDLLLDLGRFFIPGGRIGFIEVTRS